MQRTCVQRSQLSHEIALLAFVTPFEQAVHGNAAFRVTPCRDSVAEAEERRVGRESDDVDVAVLGVANAADDDDDDDAVRGPGCK